MQAAAQAIRDFFRKGDLLLLLLCVLATGFGIVVIASATNYYGNTRYDARDINFSDDFIYEELARPIPQRAVPLIPLLHEEAIHSFRLWSEKADKTEY